MTAPAVQGWFDSHCHLQDEADVPAVVARARAAGVGGIVCVGTSAPSSATAVDLAGNCGDGTVWATAGLHPHEASSGVAEVTTLVERLAAGPGGLAGARVVGIGECGFDLHYEHSPRDAQREAFAAQVALANRHGLTLVIHTRQAWDETLAVLAAEGVPERVVFHCLTGGPDELRRCLAAGAWVFFSGIVTFPNAPEVREAAALCPTDRLCVETDAPYLTPVPHRGRPNEPAFVPYVGAVVAQVRGVRPEELAASSTAAAHAAFGIAP